MSIQQIRNTLDTLEAQVLDTWRALMVTHCGGDWTDNFVCQQEINEVQTYAQLTRSFIQHIVDQRAILDAVVAVGT